MQMKNLLAAMLSLIALFVGLGLAGGMKAQTSAEDGRRNPVVVELFTSEGCSSCPPADALLRKLQEQQPVNGAEIIALEEHVDYWDHDGWMDPYSSADWTRRQQNYATLAGNDIYTPELVVDGRSQFVGNNDRKAESEITKAARSVKTQVTVRVATAEAKNSVRLNVSVEKLVGNTGEDDAEVWLAVTEDGLHSAVSRGENAGRVLQHVATLRSLRKIGIANGQGAGASFTDDPVVKFDSQWNAARLHVTVFVQKKKSREILGAASMKIRS
jgi:hypothetical protein